LQTRRIVHANQWRAARKMRHAIGTAGSTAARYEEATAHLRRAKIIGFNLPPQALT
jgi:hypothetical protein